MLCSYQEIIIGLTNGCDLFIGKEEVKPAVAEEAPAKEGDEIFTIHKPEFVSKINIIGQIDLATLNQSTRPKKKTKEEKRKEREAIYWNVRNNADQSLISRVANTLYTNDMMRLVDKRGDVSRTRLSPS